MAQVHFFRLVLFLCALNQAASNIYIATNSTQTDLCTAPCLTLSEFATRLNDYLRSNTTLVFLPGKHYLTVNISVSSIDKFSMISESTTAKIVCGEDSHIHFNYSRYIFMSNLEFVGCGGNSVKQVKEFVVQNAVFKGQNTSNTALEIVETAIQIVNSTFEQFVRGNVQFYSHINFTIGGLIIATASEINISQCKFENNGAQFGGVIYAEQHSIIVINNSIFTNNSALFTGGVLYSWRSNIVKITASKFDGNMAMEGGVLFSKEGMITIETSEFMVNAAENKGGVLLSIRSNIMIKECQFNYNTVTSGSTGEGGGVLYSNQSIITMVASMFNGNAAIINGSQCGGGVLNSRRGSITIKASQFNSNTAVITRGYASGGGVLYSETCTITIERSEFSNNSATTNGTECGGGVLKFFNNHITIRASIFNDNTAIAQGYASGGGVLYSETCTITIERSEFSNNSATTNGSHCGGGVLIFFSNNITIRASIFNGNTAITQGYGGGGGVLYSASNPMITIEVSVFDNNTATTNGRRVGGGALKSFNDNITIKASQFNGNNAIRGAVIYSYSCRITIIGGSTSNTTFVNNTATFGVIYLIRDSVLNVNTSGNVMFSNNTGSLVAFKSDIDFTGYVQFVSNHPETEISWTNSSTAIFQEGGAITLFHSNAHFKGKCTIQYNHAENGGGLLSIMSKLYVHGYLIIAHNKASRNGGGGYLSNSELNCLHKSTLGFSSNYAEHKGGGLHAISSSIEAWDSDNHCSCPTGAREPLYFNKNLADMGGGLSLEANAELIILKYLYNTKNTVDKIITFTANSAYTYGGAVYVDDDSNSGSMCTPNSTAKAECFFQILALHSQNRIDVKTQYLYFSHNQANISGSTLYGGMLDRCVASQFAEVYSKDLDPYGGVAYLKGISLLPDGDGLADFFATISSRPVKVCLCNASEYKCFHQLQAHVKVKKGAPFNVSLVAVDQLEQPVRATIQTAL